MTQAEKIQTATQVKVKMYDELNGTEVVRMIDISNVTVPDYNAKLGWEGDIIGTKEQQERGIKSWIKERANEQHDTILTLISWELV